MSIRDILSPHAFFRLSWGWDWLVAKATWGLRWDIFYSCTLHANHVYQLSISVLLYKKMYAVGLVGFGDPDQMYYLPLSIRPALSAESHASQCEQGLPPIPGLLGKWSRHFWLEQQLPVSAPDNVESRDIHNSLLRLWHPQAGKPALSPFLLSMLSDSDMQHVS